MSQTVKQVSVKRKVFDAKVKMVGRILKDHGIEFKEISGCGAMQDIDGDGDRISNFLVELGNVEMINMYDIRALEKEQDIRVLAVYHHTEGLQLAIRVLAFGVNDPFDFDGSEILKEFD